jgi:hypothetical protein
MSINVSSFTFNPSWNHDGKQINEFIGIELLATFSTYCGDEEVDTDMTLFSLKNEEFTPENLGKQMEEHMFEIIEEKFHNGDVYFRLYYNESYGMVGTPGIKTKKICDLFGSDYFDTLLQKIEDVYMNPLMASME